MGMGGKRVSICVLRGTHGVDPGARGSSDAISLLLYGPNSSRRAEERRADSGPRRAVPALFLPGGGKAGEPIAARVEPRRVQGAHQSLHHFVANADWSQEDLLR